MADRDEVLYAYALESDHGRPTLDRYMRDWPQYGPDLMAVWIEIGRMRGYWPQIVIQRIAAEISGI